MLPLCFAVDGPATYARAAPSACRSVYVGHPLSERLPAKDSDDSSRLIRHWELREAIVDQAFDGIARWRRAV